MYAIAATATGIGVAALTLLRRLERKEDDMIRRRIALSLDDAAPPLSTIVAGLSARGIVVGPAEYDKRVDERQVHVVFLRGIDLKILVSAVQSRPCPPFFQPFRRRAFRAV